jgi:HEXXH motif-containing protein
MPEAALPSDHGSTLATHELALADLDALADGAGTLAGIRQLCEAELSKHILVVHEVLVNAADKHPAAYAELQLADAFHLLVRVQEREPDVVAQILLLPGVGAWAIDCLLRLDGSDPESPALRADLAQLAAIAAAAGMRARLDFALRIPLRDGRLILPGFAPLDTRLTCEYAVLRYSVAETALHYNGSAYRLSAPLKERTRLLVRQANRALDIGFDTSDLYLARYLHHPLASIDKEVAASWTDRLAGAWRILANHHPEDAAAIAAVLDTLVPLATDHATHNVSMTSTAAFGAIAASLPPDDLTLAETLVHECQHLKLCALLDLFPMVEDRDTGWYYAPWRDDPRPVRGLLQGACAFFGVTRFWRRQRDHTPADQALRGHVEFARRRAEVLTVTSTLLASGQLTDAGARFAARMHARLLDWRHDHVPPDARWMAAEVSAEHATTWRLRHVACDPELVHRLAQSWPEGPPPDVGAGLSTTRPDTTLQVRPMQVESQHARSLLLTLRYTNPQRFRALLGDSSAAPPEFLGLSPGDLALLRGHHAAAVAAYRAEIRYGACSLDSWVGLITAARITDGYRSWKTLLRWAPLALAVHTRVRDADADPLELTAWLAKAYPELRGPSCL